jgi:hypothetical protein
MSSANEVPPIAGLDATGVATIAVHVVRDVEGRIQSGSVDFRVSYTFPGAASFTGLHIHSGNSTVSGPVTINTGLAAADGEARPAGRGTIERQGQVLANAPQARLIRSTGSFRIRPILCQPAHHRQSWRGHSSQLQAAETITLMGIMRPENEVPPVTIPATAVGTVTAIVTRDSAGALTSGEVLFDVAYDLQGTPRRSPDSCAYRRCRSERSVTLNSGLTGQGAFR